MTRSNWLAVIAAALLIGIVQSAQAQSPGTNRFSYVASYGANGAPCTQNAPCDSLSGAIGTTRDGGTVLCLDNIAPSASTAGAVIDRSITIDCRDNHYHQASNLTVTAGASALVAIKGVHLNGHCAVCSETAGIVINSARSVILEDIAVSRHDNGVRDQRTGGQTRLYIKDSIFSYNEGGGVIGAAQGVSALVLDNVKLLNNNYGLAVAAGNNVVVSRSTISGNTTAGVHADGGAQINLLNSVLSHNTANINAYGTVRLQENTIQFSNVAIQGTGAISLGSNRFAGNGSLGSAAAPASGAPADVFN